MGYTAPMGILYIAGQSPGAGSTALAAALATLWRGTGKRVALFKPLALPSDTPQADAQFFATITPGTHPGMLTSVLNSSSDMSGALMKGITANVDALGRDADVVIIDGLPILDLSGSPVEASAALAQKLGAAVLGIMPQTHGTETPVAASWQATFGETLAGLVLNHRTRYATTDTNSPPSSTARPTGTTVLGRIPEERLMLAPTVSQIAAHLQAQFFTRPTGDQLLVEKFIIGGLITEWGGNYFGRYPSQAVVVRGGRSDIAMAALKFPMACLLLTSCDVPSQYVFQRAEEQGVPLITVTHDTMETTRLLESIHQRVSVHHPAKIQRFANLLGSQLDWNRLNAAASLV